MVVTGYGQRVLSSDGRSEALLGPDNNIEFLKHFMNIIMKN